MAGRRKAQRRPVIPRGAVTVPKKAVDVAHVPRLERTDVLFAGAAALVAGLLFLTTFSTHVALGDAPETVSGVRTLGVLHAPGYPSFVAVAHLFANAVPVGGWAARVNAFSLCCAALTVGAVSLLARNYGATRPGAALGAFLLASTASFWFNADFAKHYAFSGLLVTLAALGVAHWQSGAPSRWFIVASALLGLGLGASWELTAIMAVGLAVAVAFGNRRADPRLIAAALTTLVVVGTAAYAFLMWRAGQHPAVNWGEVTDLHRLVAQITQRDFRGQDVGTSHNNLAVKLAMRVPAYAAITVRDVGVGACIVALFGVVFGTRSLERGRKLFLAVVAGLNLVAVLAVAGIDHISGFLTGIVAGGYLVDLLIVVAILVALGTAPIVEYATDFVTRAMLPRRYKPRTAQSATRLRSRVTGAVFVAVLLPSLLVHYHHADHRQPPLADAYAHRILAALPRHAALVVLQADLTFPLVYRQAVLAERRDVGIIVATSLQFDWYREQIGRTLRLRQPLTGGPVDRQTFALINNLRAKRRVFIDTSMMSIFRPRIAYRLQGLVGEVVAPSADRSIDRPALSDDLVRADRVDGIAGHANVRFPNAYVHYLYARAHIELAKQYASASQLAPARTELKRALNDFPDDHTTRLVLQYSAQPGENPAKIARVIEAL